MSVRDAREDDRRTDRSVEHAVETEPESGIDLRRDWPQLLALAVSTLACAVVVGPLGVVAGLAAAITWYALGTPYAIAVGHVVLVALLPSRIGPLSFAILEFGFVALVLASATRVRRPRRFAVVALASAAGLGGVAWLVARSRPLWLAAAALVAAFGLAAYGIHRYELVQLGLVPDSKDSSSARFDPRTKSEGTHSTSTSADAASAPETTDTTNS